MGTILKNGISYSGSGSGSGGVSSYNELTDKPSINNVTLTGNKTTSDLGIATSDACYTTDDTAETTLADGDYFPFYDTSASGKRKSLWSNIKSVLKTYFDTLYNAKLTAGTNISFSGTNNATINASMPVMSTFSKEGIFSTTEKVIGCWTDGRPLYKKTVSFGSGANKTTKSVSHGISYLKECIKIESIGGGSGYYWPLNYSGNGQDVIVYADSSKIYMQATDDQSACTYYMTLYYTKTSDSANSYALSSENDYSTSEKIVGTWTGGQTLYQRTYTGTAPSDSGSVVITSGLSSYTIRKIDGMVKQSGGLLQSTVNCCQIYNGTTYYVMCFMGTSGNLFLQTNTPQVYNGTYYITVQYTK